MALSIASVFLSLLSISHAVQPSAPNAIPAPLRDLKWGQLNFLHTTDTHGWLAGHLQEAPYSADWGDYVSFATRMREKAEAQGQDLLVVDTGDRVEGNGLYDSSDPKGVYLSEILKRQHVDIITVGNHELYQQKTAEAEFFTTVSNFRGNYLASNLDMIHPTTKEAMPFAPRYKKFTTKNQGIRIVAFGFIYDFSKNYNNTIVQPVEETVKEEWFQEAIRDKDIDLFLVAGHVPVASKESTAIFKAIRSVRYDTPIQFLGGHYHIRDYAKYDSRAYGLASGRFMETVGFMSINGLTTHQQKSSAPSFNRRYIDNNLYSFHHHSGLNETTFPTEDGQKVTQLIEKSRSALNLDKVYGCAPRDLWLSRVKYPSNDSIYTWLEKQVIPESVKDESRKGKPALALVNTGAIRFDIFKGPFTQDSVFIVSPFTSGFRYLKDVPYEKAKLIVEVLNKQQQVLATSQYHSDFLPWTLAPPEQSALSEDIIPEESAWDHLAGQAPLSKRGEKSQILPGYTTTDAGGTDGDDTIHSPIPAYRVPNVIDVLINNGSVPETVDLVYIDFMQSFMPMAAKFAGLDVDANKDSDVYGSTSFTNLMLEWVKNNWRCEA